MATKLFTKVIKEHKGLNRQDRRRQAKLIELAERKTAKKKFNKIRKQKRVALEKNNKNK